MRAFGPYATLLGRSAALRTLGLAGAASQLGSWIAYVALSVDVFDRTHSAAWVGALLLVDFLPSIVIGVALAPLVDRFSRRRLMVASDLVNASVFLAVPFARGPADLVVLAAVSGFANGFFRPALNAELPRLVPERDLARANALLETVSNLALVAGPVVAGALVAGGGVRAAYWVNAVSFLASAALLARLAIPPRPLSADGAADGRPGHWAQVREGMRLYAERRVLLGVLVSWGVATLAVGAVNVGEILLAKDVLGAGNVGFGLLASASGVGLVAGSLLAGSLAERRHPYSLYVAVLLVDALGIGIAASAQTLAQAVVGVTLGAAANGVAIVSFRVLLQREVPEGLLGRAFGLLQAVASASVVTSMVAAGIVAEVAGVRALWASAAAALVLAAATAVLLGARRERPAATVAASP